MEEADLERRVAAIRRFNRFYTKQIGVLRGGLLKSPFSLTEVRVLYELAHREAPTATELGQELGLDAGYLSRILSGLARRRLVQKTTSEADGRQSLLSLTKQGREAFAALDVRASDEIRAMLKDVAAPEQGRLVEAMHTIEGVLGAAPEKRAPYLLRPPQPGDMGWVIHRHGALYAQEYGWDERFEALVAGIVANFAHHHDPKRERCWIAEKDGAIVGSVFLVERRKTVGQLRLLLVEPSARGLGIGQRLVGECIRFARQVGYRKVVLWTNDVLHAARRIYEKAGFRLVHQQPNDSFGHDLVEQDWELTLSKT